MDVIQAFLDGVAIAAIFNGAVATLVLINPRFFFNSYPKAIQKKGRTRTNDKTGEEDKQDINRFHCWNLFCLFDSKRFTQRDYRFLECVLDGIYSVEHIKIR